MAQRCETCGADNPATNRYCGQCGRRLERIASDTPEEFWRGVGGNNPFEHVEASADLPPEVIDFDNRIPLIADSGTDRRLHPPPELVEQVHDHLDREAELHDQLQHESKPHFEVLADDEAERERLRESRSEYLRWDTNSDTNSDTNEATNSHPDDTDSITNDDRHSRLNSYANEITDQPNGNAGLGPNAEPGAALPVAHRNFVPEGERTTGTGVSGPSFLGLTDDRAPEYADEEPEPESHLRRNLALGILAAVIVLAGLQWRSIRDYGLAYVQNGSMRVKPIVKGALPNPPAVAAEHTSRDLGPSGATTKTGAAQAVESSPNADRALPVQQTPSSPQPGKEKVADIPASPAVPAATTSPAVSAPVPAVPKNPPPAVVSHSAAKPRPFRNPPPAHSVPRATPVPGGDEMNRAAAARDSEARAALLWKAVGKGNPQAPLELARMYEQGKGVVRSCDQAQILLRSAAAKGNSQAKFNLQQIRARGGCSAR